MVDNDYSSNRQHEYINSPNSDLVGAHRSAANRFASIQPFPTIFQQVVVREIFYDPNLLDDTRIDELITKYNLSQVSYLKRMPRHSILGEYVRDGNTPQQDPQIFFPFFPSHLILPVKPGERIWVYKESNKNVDYGYWICRITEPRDIEDLNFTHSDRKFDFSSNSSEQPKFNNGAIIDSKGQPTYDAASASIIGSENEYENIIQNSDAGSVIDFESVPRYTARPGDYILQGSNNTLISLGTDRTSSASDVENNPNAPSRKGKRSKGKPQQDTKLNAGTIDIVVGRGQEKSKNKAKTIKNSLKNDETDKKVDSDSEGDPDFLNDSSRIYVSMKTAADDNFKIKTKGIDPKLTKGKEDSAIVMKSNHLRFISRKEIRIIVQPNPDSPDSECPAIILKENGEIVIIPSDKAIIKLGGDDADKAILCSNQGVAGKENGQITCPPLVTTMGGIFGIAGAHGMFAQKILVK